MQRVVLDVNVYVAALLSPAGTPAQVLLAWTRDEYELIVSPQLLTELERVLRRTKFSRSISDAEINALVEAFREDATLLPDPPAEPGLTPDPKDDYLITLARAAQADCIVSGDAHLTGTRRRPPVGANSERVPRDLKPCTGVPEQPQATATQPLEATT